MPPLIPTLLLAPQRPSYMSCDAESLCGEGCMGRWSACGRFRVRPLVTAGKCKAGATPTSTWWAERIQSLASPNRHLVKHNPNTFVTDQVWPGPTPNASKLAHDWPKPAKHWSDPFISGRGSSTFLEGTRPRFGGRRPIWPEPTSVCPTPAQLRAKPPDVASSPSEFGSV